MKHFYYRYVRFPLLVLLVLTAATATLKHFSRRIVPASYAATPPSIMPGGGSVMTSRSSSTFFYFTDYERTRFDDFIWFFAGDSVIAPYPVIMHSNSDIGVLTGAYFGCYVSTSGNLLSTHGSSFYGYPPPGYGEHIRPYRATSGMRALRDSARSGYPSGHWFSTSDNQYIWGLWFHGTSATMWRWDTGTPFPPYLDFTRTVGEISWSPTRPHAIYSDGTLWISGTVQGQLGIGAHGTIRLMGDICYQDVSQTNNWTIPANSTNYLTIISDAEEPYNDYLQNLYYPWTGIVIANTWENGRENGGNVYPAQQNRRDIVITAQLITLNSSFTFEQQNDSWDPYQAPSTLAQDYRGYIHLRGNVIQHRRGHVHRSNHGGTGYFKEYKYDTRFIRNPPPFSITFSQ